jgi:superfamily II DNA or RNA helicase
MTTTYLGNKGYTIVKEFMDEKEQQWIRENLTPKPYIPGSPIQPPSFKVYQESLKKLYIPRCFGIKHYGAPDENRIPKGDTINLSFKGELRDYQKNIVNTYLKSNDGSGAANAPVGLLEIPCGRGKCLAKNTPILMYDWTIKKIQNVKVGDVIMGDDSTPRIIQSLARGRETMYKIHTDTEDTSYIVNESHILSLKQEDDKIVDIPLLDYLKRDSYDTTLYGYRVAIKDNEQEQERETISCIKAYAHGYNRSQFDKGLTAYSLSSNEPYHVLNMNYVKSKRTIRLHILAGILAYNHFNNHIGYYDKEHYLNIINISSQFADDILFLVRSLGFSGVKSVLKSKYDIDIDTNTNTNSKTTSSTSEYVDIIREMNTVYRVDLYFPTEEDIYSIPIRNTKEWIQKNIATNDRILPHMSRYKIKVERLEEDDYYGFEIDGNRRFVLGDFTVTHNTVIALNIISQLKTKTLVVVHKGFLLNQWVERIEQFLHGARIGKIQGQVIDIENKDIVIGMIQSLSMKEYPQDMFSSFGLTIVDECHHISSEVFSRTLQKIVTRCMLGLSATMERKDGLTPVFKMFLGNIVYSEKREEEDPVLVKGIEYIAKDDDEFNETKYDYRGNPAFSTMITKICSYSRRTEFILEVLKKELEIKADQQIMILAHNRNLLTYLYKAIEHRNIATVGYYVGGMKEEDLKKSETKKVIVATYSMAAEGLDIKTLSTLILATPKTDVVQAVGRILRVKHERPLIIDIVDSHDMFKKQWYKRRAFYLKCKYRVMYTNNEGYLNDKWRETKDARNNKKKNPAISSQSRKVNKSDGLLNDDAFEDADGDGYLDCEDVDDEDEDYDDTPKNRNKSIIFGKCMLDLE